MLKSKEEQIKLHSTYLNNIAVAMLGSGVIVPIFAIVFSSSPDYKGLLDGNYTGWTIFSFICKAIGVILYIIMSFVVKKAATKNLTFLDQPSSP